MISARGLRSTSGPVLAVAAAVAIGLASESTHANPYASGITESGGNVEFILNEAATDVTVYRDGVATSLGALGAGSHSFARNGASTYQIQVSKTGAPSGYTQISTDSTFTNFEIPRGVGVNTNSSLGGAPNPYFGRVYVSNGRESATVNGRSMVSGFYGLNADLSSVFEARTGGVVWLPPTDSVSPLRVQVGPDNQLYVADWSDSHSGLWALDPDANTNVEVLDSTGRDGVGLNSVHGSISDVVIRGTGASRTIYTTDEDFNGGEKGIYQYNIGTTPTTITPPTTLYNNSTNLIINSFDSLDQSPDGTFWMSQNRSGIVDEANPSLIQVDGSGNVLFSSLTLAANGDSATDPLRNTQGIAFDPVNDVIALATSRSGGDGLIIIFDDDTKTILSSFAFGGGTTNCDVVFDAAGNLYVTNRSAEQLRVWSPGGDSIFTTDSLGDFYAGVAVPEPASLAAIAMGGLALLSRRRR